MPRLRLLGAVLHRLHLTPAAHELRAAACRRALKTSAQLPLSSDLIDLQWLADPLDACRSKRLQREIALYQLAHGLADRDRAGCRKCLKAGCDASRVPYGGVLGVILAGPDPAQHYLSGVGSDPHLQIHSFFGAQLLGVAPDSCLHSQCREQCSLRVVLVREGSAEQGEDAVTRGLCDV